MKKRAFALTAAVALVIAMLMTACTVPKFKLNFDVDGAVVYTIDTSGEEAITLPENPSKDGFVFDGWFWDKDVWEKPFTVNSLLDAPLSSDMTVYAKWRGANEAPEFAVTFETNGGTAVASGSYSVIETAPESRCDGYTFEGWYTDANLGAASKITFPYTATADVTLYAKWTEVTEGYFVTFETNGGTAIPTARYSVIQTAPLTQKDYIFLSLGTRIRISMRPRA